LHPKNKDTWCKILAGKTPNKIQPRDLLVNNSKGGGIDGISHMAEPERQPQRPVSRQLERQAQAEPQLVRQRLERELPFPRLP